MTLLRSLTLTCDAPLLHRAALCSLPLTAGRVQYVAAECPHASLPSTPMHRFMFLMLGETILQIIVAIAPGNVVGPADDPFFNIPMVTAAYGFVLACSMMLSFRSMVRGQLDNYDRTNTGLAKQASETDALMQTLVATQAQQAPVGPAASDDPSRASSTVDRGPQRGSIIKKLIDTTALDTRFEKKAERLLMSMHMYNLVNSLLWQTKALSIMLVGVGVKCATQSAGVPCPTKASRPWCCPGRCGWVAGGLQAGCGWVAGGLRVGCGWAAGQRSSLPPLNVPCAQAGHLRSNRFCGRALRL